MASINTSSNDPFYLAYRFAGPSADLIVPAVALYLVVLVGIVFNGAVLVVTAKSNSLRGSANFLMALICFCELVHQIGHTFFLVVVISGTNFVSLLTADLFMAPMIFALNCDLMAMFCAAFDRLFAVISPHKHSSIFTKYKLPYLLGHLFICVIYAALVQCFVLDYAFENAGNTEYRRAFKKEFQALKGYFGNKNAVRIIGINQVRSANPNNNVRSSKQINPQPIQMNRF